MVVQLALVSDLNEKAINKVGTPSWSDEVLQSQCVFSKSDVLTPRRQAHSHCYTVIPFSVLL